MRETDLPRSLLPEGWPRPKGYANGMIAQGQVIMTGGVVGWDANERFATGLVAQFEQVLRNIIAILEAGGAGPQHLVRLTWYVTDIASYRASLPDIGAAYRRVIGRHFPAMAVVQVLSLVEPEALIEIEATAVIP